MFVVFVATSFCEFIFRHTLRKSWVFFSSVLFTGLIKLKVDLRRSCVCSGRQQLLRLSAIGFTMTSRSVDFRFNGFLNMNCYRCSLLLLGQESSDAYDDDSDDF